MTSPAHPFSLTKNERLHGKKDIAALLSKGKFRNQGIIRYCFTADNGLGYGRMMVSVPKKLFKRAVKRNIIKRRIRESYRLQKGILPEGAGADMLFIYNSKEIAESGEIFAAVRAILKDIGHEIRKSKGDS